MFGRRTRKKMVGEELGASQVDASFPLLSASAETESLDSAVALGCLATSQQVSAVFGEVVAVLMRTPQYRSLTLADLEWFVLPALRSGQVSVAMAQTKTTATPVGAVLWASVSAAVGRRLAAHPSGAMRLEPAEWRSGEIIWVVASAGERRVLGDMLQRLAAGEWAGKEVLVTVDTGGDPTVAALVRGAEAA